MNKLFEFDLLILSTKGDSGVEEVLIGYRKADVVSCVKKPVLVVPDNSTELNFDTNWLLIYGG